jgi:hypothetical protein
VVTPTESELSGKPTMAGAALQIATALIAAAGSAQADLPPLPPPCACAEQHYCKPLSTPASDFEIFPFVIGSSLKGDNLTKDWMEVFRWDLITTASWTIGANETICKAHKNGARVVTAASMAIGGKKPLLPPQLSPQVDFRRFS